MTTNQTDAPAVAVPLQCSVGRQKPEAQKQSEPVRNRVLGRTWPVCWYCDREINPLDDLHHLWCHGGA
jgi:hypothetical protein